MKRIVCFILSILLTLSFIGCTNQNENVPIDKAKIKAEIEQILQFQEDAYDSKIPEERKKILATCEDSLIYIGGDSGGLATSSIGYVQDFADGYSKRPYNRFFQIYDNTVIVTSLHQSYKLLAGDTLFLNARSTKIFRRHGAEWKMAYITNTPLPVIYTKPKYDNPKAFVDYQGVYSIDPSVSDTISLVDGKLYSTITGADRSELIPINDSTFIGQGYFGKAVFARNAKGKVTHYYFEWTDGQRINFLKIK